MRPRPARRVELARSGWLERAADRDAHRSAGDETRPLKSKVIVAGAPVTVTDCAAGLRRAERLAVADRDDTLQPCAQPAPHAR